MTVAENALLQQMQQMAANLAVMQQGSGGKGKDSEEVSFQDMLKQSGKTAEPTTGKEAKDQPAQEGGAVQEGKVPGQDEEQEELKVEVLAGNPNAVSYVDLFRPEIVAAEPETAAIPVEGVPQDGVEQPAMDLEGQMPAMETEVGGETEAEIPMGGQPGEFQQQLKTVPQTEEAAPRTEEAAPQERAEAPGEVKESVPVEQGVEKADKPAEARETEGGLKAEAPETQEAPEMEEAPESDEPPAGAVEAEQPVFHEAESAPIKVGETYEAVDTEKPGMERELAVTIREAADQGQERVEIRLTPQSLGSLTIEMTRDASGTLQVVLHASNAKAAGLLTEHLDGLHAALQGYGYGREEVRVEVPRPQEGQQQNFRQADPDGRNQQHQQHREERREERPSGEEFMQKLRLGLFGAEEA